MQRLTRRRWAEVAVAVDRNVTVPPFPKIHLLLTPDLVAVKCFTAVARVSSCMAASSHCLPSNAGTPRTGYATVIDLPSGSF